MTDRIEMLWPALVPDHPVLVGLAPVSESRFHTVWKAVTADGRVFAVKHHLFAALPRGKPYDLIATDVRVTALLRAAGVSVPEVMAANAGDGLTVYRWSGEETLDDHCQQPDAMPVADKVLDLLVGLASTFERHKADLATRVAPGGRPDEVLASFADLTEPIGAFLPDLIHQLTGVRPPDAPEHWDAILGIIHAAPLALGPTDYNARNIVLSDALKPSVLECAKIGYDWPERRIIQYTTSPGAHLPNGRMIGLLSPAHAGLWAEQSAAFRSESAGQILAHYDRHHFIFHVLAACQALRGEHPNVGGPWQNNRARLTDIAAALSTPFSNCAHTDALRSHFHT
ncbi:MAG: hypothetical protein O3B73_06025 [bacterium]|nr:hypothetical protein [bacterium]